MKKWMAIYSFILLSIVLLGCQQSDLDTSSNTANWPSEMPNDFNFSVQFGYGKKNEINTFNQTITKDLIVDGTVTTSISLTEEEMKDIYEEMNKLDLEKPKEFIPKPVNGTVCQREPHEDDEWNITINNENFTFNIPGQYCEPSEDAKQLLELRNYVFGIVKTKAEYQSLPEPSGGYE